MKDRRPSRRIVLLLAAAIVAVGVAVAVGATGAFERIELASVDARFAVRGAQDPPADIVIVGIDDKTLDAKPKASLPLNRMRHATVIDALTKAGAGVIAYDIQFTTESDDADADNALIEAVRGARTIVLGTDDVERDGSTEIFGGGEGLEYSEAIPSDTNFVNDDDERVRRMPFALNHLDNFALAAVRLHRGNRFRAPAGREAWIDYPGPPGTIPTISFADVEQGRFDPKAVKGKLVVVGATASQAQDRRATPTSGDRTMPAPEIEAAEMATVLRGFPLRTAAGWVDVLLALVLAAVAPLVAMRFGTVVGLAVGLLAVVGFVVGAQVAFDQGTIVALVPPLAGAFVGLTATLFSGNPQRSPLLNRALDRLTPKGGNQRTRRLRASLLLAAAFSVVTIALIADAGHVLRNADLSTVDMRFGVRGAEPPPPSVVVVGIDSKTLDTEPKPTYPLGRELYARAIRNLTRAGASVVAMDVEFTEPSGNKKADADLIEALRDAPRVVLSATETDGSGAAKVISFGKGLTYSRGIPAITLVVKDNDGSVRHMTFSQQELISFPLASAQAMVGRRIATPGGTTAWIDYAGPGFTIPHISFVDVLQGRFNPAQVRGKVVVVGATQTSLQDQHSTSTTGNFLMPGPEIQANSIATALAGFPLHDAAWWVDILLIVVVGVAAPLAGLRLGLVPAVGFGAAVVAAFLVGAQLAFQHADTIVTVIYPFAAGLAGILLTAAIHGLTVAFEREQARDAFARFVPEAVVDQVLSAADGVRLGGVRGEATVMFSDLRGFTSFSETLEPERVIESLNRYLTEMSEAILNHGGTLVAYMGDGIMAVFGAPLKQDDHADRALEAAREMLERMEGFNDWLRGQSLHDGFKMGIGLNSGAVMSGNVGSERRLEYTALGDTTNTAARLEGMTKGTPHQLYLADTTKQMLTRPADDLVAVGEAEVRGRKAKVLLWSLSEAPAPEVSTETSTARAPGAVL